MGGIRGVTEWLPAARWLLVAAATGCAGPSVLAPPPREVTVVSPSTGLDCLDRVYAAFKDSDFRESDRLRLPPPPKGQAQAFFVSRATGIGHGWGVVVQTMELQGGRCAYRLSAVTADWCDGLSCEWSPSRNPDLERQLPALEARLEAAQPGEHPEGAPPGR